MADEKPQNESNESQAEVGESVAPEPNPLVTALLGQFPSDVQHEGEDTAGLPLVRTDVDNVINVLTWLRDNELTKFDYLASLTVMIGPSARRGSTWFTISIPSLRTTS